MNAQAHKTVFSDQDLEDLKDAVWTEITAAVGEGGAWYTLFTTDKVEALIRRLEEAEACMDDPHRVAAWRRAAGQ